MPTLIEIEHLFDALKGFSRPLREGREAVVNIIEPVGLKPTSTTRFAKVLAFCIRTTKINEAPVRIEVEIDREAKKVEEKIVTISCSCPAGASKEHCCKHAVAVLIYLEKNDEKKLELLTCTEVEQGWGNISEETLSRFCPIPLSEFCHVKKTQFEYRRPVVEVTPTLEKEFRSLFLEAQPNSEAAIFISNVRERHVQEDKPPALPFSNTLLSSIVDHAFSYPHYILKRMAEVTEQLYNECAPEEKKYYDENIRVTKEEAIKMCIDTNGQDNVLWDLFRYGRFTGSKIYEIYTYAKNKNPNWNSKFMNIFKSNGVLTSAMQDGLMFEPDARERYEQKYEKKVGTAGILVNPLVPWLGFSPDGVVLVNDKPDRLWENKTPQCGRKDSVDVTQIAGLYSSVMSGGKLKHKHKYYGQIQLGMLLTALSMCDFTLYCVGVDDIYVDTVMLDENFCLDMLERTANVYFKKCLPWLCTHPYEA